MFHRYAVTPRGSEWQHATPLHRRVLLVTPESRSLIALLCSGSRSKKRESIYRLTCDRQLPAEALNHCAYRTNQSVIFACAVLLRSSRTSRAVVKLSLDAPRAFLYSRTENAFPYRRTLSHSFTWPSCAHTMKPTPTRLTTDRLFIRLFLTLNRNV